MPTPVKLGSSVLLNPIDHGSILKQTATFDKTKIHYKN